VPEQKMILSNKPQINISCPSASRMWLVCGCAFLCVLQSSFGDGGRSLIVAFAALFSAMLIELLLTWRNYGFGKVRDGSAAATAMILTLLLPNLIHPFYAALGAAFAVTVVKYSFGGLGSNWLNPAVGGWLFIRFSWPAAFAKALEGSPSSISEMTIASGASALDSSATEFLNNTVFSITGTQMPPGYIDLLFNNNPGIITDRGLFSLLIGTICITATGINRGWIPLVFIAVYCFLIRLAGDLTGLLWNGDMLYGIFSGGTIAAAFILAAEPTSGAKFKPGIIFVVFSGAVLSWLFRYRCMEYSGCFIAFAVINCFTPLIKFAEEKIFLSRNNHGGFQENLL
jgi:electron transport complex protein RnfD